MAEAKKTMSKKVTTVKNLKKWKTEFNCKFSYDLCDNKVCRLRCGTCCRSEGIIKSTKNFSTTWITGSESISKDSVSKHVKSEQHKLAIKKQQQSELGADVYRESVIAKSFLPKLSPKDRAGLRIKVNTVYHLIKNERPFTDYPKLLELQKKNFVPELLDNQIYPDPDPVIDKWFADKTHHLTAGPHNYGERSKNNDGSTNSYIDLDKLTMSDLESADEFESFEI